MNLEEKRLSAAQLRLRQRHPFFATLALFAPVQVTEEVETAATDGKTVFFNPGFLASIDNGELNAVLLHEVLHAALLHVPRRQGREPLRWNYAADVVVNGMVRAQGLDLPKGALTKKAWENHSVEEIYQMLVANQVRIPKKLLLDLRQAAGSGLEAGEGALEQHQRVSLEAYWKTARAQAEVIARQQAAKRKGNEQGGFGRDWESLSQPRIDWRSELWRFLVRTPTDFSGFDRRFVYRGIYIDAMEGESLRLWVAIDTSGSIGKQELEAFHAELMGILRSYPHIDCQLYFADTGLYGPYQVHSDLSMPEPKGGGGTSFVPFFHELTDATDADRPDVCVYLTDGYGDFPKSPPGIPTLWVVTVPGLDVQNFPFGQVAPLLF